MKLTPTISISQIAAMTPAERLETISLRNIFMMGKRAPQIVAKILYHAGESGDFGDGEMNEFARNATGLELRRGLQGTYECVNVLKAIHSGRIPMTELDFDKAPKFGLIKLSSFLSTYPDKVEEACRIIASRKDVTSRLKALSQE